MKNIELISELITGRVRPQIYAFTTNTIPNYLKVGDTYRALEVRLNEWKKHFPDLQQVYNSEASIDEDIFFRDYAVHDFLVHDKGKYRLLVEDMVGFPPKTYYSKEFFKGTTEIDVAEAIDDIQRSIKIMIISINFIMLKICHLKHMYTLLLDTGHRGLISRKQLITLLRL